MLKLFKISFILIISPFLAQGQALDTTYAPTPQKNYFKQIHVGFSVGISMPMGSFSNKNNEVNNAAFAKTGFNYNMIDAGYRMGKTLGVCASYINVNNELSVKDLIQRINQNNAIKFVHGQSGDYQMNGLILGLLVSKKDRIIDLDLKFMGGISNVYIPQLVLDYKNASTNEVETIRYKPINKNTFGVGLSAGFRVHITQHLDFMCHGNYLIFQNTFDRQVESVQGVSIEKTKLNYEVFNLNIGIAYRFLNDKRL